MNGNGAHASNADPFGRRRWRDRTVGWARTYAAPAGLDLVSV